MAKVKLGKKEFLVDCDVIDANGCEVSAADCNALCARMRSGEINRVTELFLVRFFFDLFILHFCAGCMRCRRLFFAALVRATRCS